MSVSPALLLSLLLCLCFVAVIAVVGGAIYFFLNRGVQGLNRTWGGLATATGLTLKPGGIFSQPELNGALRHRPIRLYSYNAGSQGNRNTYTAVALTVKNPADSAMEITPSGSVGNVLGRMVRAQDVEIGNPEFDARFVLKSNPPKLAPNALGEAQLTAAIMEIPGPFRIELKGPLLEYSKRGLEENTDFLGKMFNTLSDIADRLEALA